MASYILGKAIIRIADVLVLRKRSTDVRNVTAPWFTHGFTGEKDLAQ